MKPLTRKEISDCIACLKRAKKQIAKGRERSVRLAVEVSCNANQHHIYLYLNYWLESMCDIKVHGHYSLVDWLFFKHNLFLSEEEYKEIRLRWIDWMIGELRKELA